MSSPGLAGPASLRQLLDAVMAIGTDLDLRATLQRIIEAATALVDARYGALGVLNVEGDALVQFITVGIDEEGHHAIGELPKGHGILGLLIADPRPLRLADLQQHPDRYGFPAHHPEMRSFLGVPVTVRGKVFGNLYLTDKQTGDVFTDIDQELTVALAAAAGVAIENARLHARVRELALLEDRERIAMDLHDTVIQRLFATGMSLQATSRLASEPAITLRIQSAVDDLDTTIGQIRSSIFALSTTSQPSGTGLRARVLEVVDEMTAALAAQPLVHFAGPVDTTIAPELGDDLVVTLRELLSNVARHAQARRVEVFIGVDGREAVVRVLDDGLGLPADAHERGGRGLRNLATRAARCGGTFGARAEPDGGTVAEWRVPLVR